MEIKKLQQVRFITDVLCDVCKQSTTLKFATFSAHWGYGSTHDGDRYELQLCEKCFSYALARLTGEPLLFKGSDFSQTDIAIVGAGNDG